MEQPPAQRLRFANAEAARKYITSSGDVDKIVWHKVLKDSSVSAARELAVQFAQARAVLYDASNGADEVWRTFFQRVFPQIYEITADLPQWITSMQFPLRWPQWRSYFYWTLHFHRTLLREWHTLMWDKFNHDSPNAFVTFKSFEFAPYKGADVFYEEGVVLGVPLFRQNFEATGRLHEVIKDQFFSGLFWDYTDELYGRLPLFVQLLNNGNSPAMQVDLNNEVIGLTPDRLAYVSWLHNMATDAYLQENVVDIVHAPTARLGANTPDGLRQLWNARAPFYEDFLQGRSMTDEGRTVARSLLPTRRKWDGQKIHLGAQVAAARSRCAHCTAPDRHKTHLVENTVDGHVFCNAACQRAFYA